MLYDLSDYVARERFTRRCSSLAEKGSRVELREIANRTLSQNAYLHVILGYFAMETGYTLDFVKRNYFKSVCNADLFVTEVDGKFGRATVLRSTSELTKEQMSVAIDRFRNWSSAEAGIYLPEANEQEFLRSIEKELDKYSNYYTTR